MGIKAEGFNRDVIAYFISDTIFVCGMKKIFKEDSFLSFFLNIFARIPGG